MGSRTVLLRLCVVTVTALALMAPEAVRPVRSGVPGTGGAAEATPLAAPRAAPHDAATARAERRRAPRPVVWDRPFPDPSVAATPFGYVALATGPLAPRMSSYDGRTWRPEQPALTHLPPWAHDAAIWAADLERVGKRWVLYYSAMVGGMGFGQRCIGVAVSDGALGTFRPVGSAPLVCPRRARTPKAGDRVPRKKRMPSTGVIDPSLFRDRGRLFLLYKTQGHPSSIRMVRLSRDGLRAAGRSRMLVKHSGTIENPVLVRRKQQFYLFTSVGSYLSCKYHTTWRRSADRWKWRKAKQHTLLNRTRTGICGPGGADVVVEPSLGRTSIFLHGWVCDRSADPCRRNFHAEDVFPIHKSRAMYAARLSFKRGRPRVTRWLTGS